MLDASLLNRRFAQRAAARLATPVATTPPGTVVRRRGFVRVVRRTLEWIGALSIVGLIVLVSLPGNRAGIAQGATDLVALLRSDDGSARPDGRFLADGAADLPVMGQVVDLSAPNAFVATYLSHRYHVADDAVRLVVAAANAESEQRHVDPLLVLAVMAVESSMNPFAQSAVGATGLMQVMPGVHRSKFQAFRRDAGPLDPVSNIRAGTQILADLIARGGSVERGLQLYVGAGNLDSDSGYAGRVLGEMARLRQAASGQVAAALAAAWRADQARAADPRGMELAQNS